MISSALVERAAVVQPPAHDGDHRDCSISLKFRICIAIRASVGASGSAVAVEPARHAKSNLGAGKCPALRASRGTIYGSALCIDGAPWPALPPAAS